MQPVSAIYKPHYSATTIHTAVAVGPYAWHCEECERLLGKQRRSGLELRYKESLFIVNGLEFMVTALCPRCSFRSALSCTHKRVDV
jgi:hypothetical protein